MNTHCHCSKNDAGNENEFQFFTSSIRRILTAKAFTESTLATALAGQKPIVSDEFVHLFERGLCVVSAAGVENAVHVAISSVIDKVPYEFMLSYDISTLLHENDDLKAADIMWITLTIATPFKRTFKIPIQGVGVVRANGNLVSVRNWELAPSLLNEVNGKEVGSFIICLIACAGLACGWSCWYLCTPATIPACIACIIACAGARAPAIAACMVGCKAFIDSL
jgi:hypothetical protein